MRTNDRSQNRRMEKDLQMQRDQAMADAAIVMRSPEGRRFVRLVLDECYEGQVTFVRDDPSGRESAFQEGRRSVAIAMLALLEEGCPKLVDHMQAEARVARLRAQAAERQRDHQEETDAAAL